jgi:formylglycine-generating enzyme required for sulfatase activity
VTASGYVEAAYLQGLPFDNGTWQSSVQQFVDLTGRPGPSAWQAGTYPDGTADLPVTGISWFEAAAYSRFRGKERPTAYHWYRAASSVLAQQLAYRSAPVAARVEKVDSANTAWTRERIELPTDCEDTRFAVQPFLPVGHEPPHQVALATLDWFDRYLGPMAR